MFRGFLYEYNNNNSTHLKLMWHACKIHDGEVVVAGSSKLKAKDISCSG